MIIWGTRTKREGRGFVIRRCPRCAVDRIHFVAEAKTKFTLYFVPTFTTSTKAFLVCTTCEWVEELGGEEARGHLLGAKSQDAILAELRGRELGASGSSTSGADGLTPARTMAVGAVALAMSAALADGSISDGETVAIVHAIQTVAEATRSVAVRDVATTATAEFMPIVQYIVSPATPPVPLMLAQAGSAARRLPDPDRSRYVGQLSWLGHTIAAAGPPDESAALAAMDSALEHMGFGAHEISAALAFCQAQGG